MSYCIFSLPRRSPAPSPKYLAQRTRKRSLLSTFKCPGPLDGHIFLKSDNIKNEPCGRISPIVTGNGPDSQVEDKGYDLRHTESFLGRLGTYKRRKICKGV